MNAAEKRKTWLMIAFITCNSNLVPLLEGQCSWNPCRFESSVFWVFAEIELTTSGLIVPRSDQLLYLCLWTIPLLALVWEDDIWSGHVLQWSFAWARPWLLSYCCFPCPNPIPQIFARVIKIHHLKVFSVTPVKSREFTVSFPQNWGGETSARAHTASLRKCASPFKVLGPWWVH